MKKKLKTILIILFILSIIELINIYSLSIKSKLLEVKFNDDKIITLNSAVGEKKVVAYNDKFESDGTKSKIFAYRTSSVSKNDVLIYIGKLKKYGFVYTEESDINVKQLGKKSISEDKTILVNFEYDSNNKYLYIKYVMTDGTFKRSTKD